MKFEDAMAAMRENKKLKRKEWTGSTWYTIKSYLTSNSDSTEDSLFVSDLMAEDWEIVE